jgi:glucose/arabinose dehydrogenase
MIRFSPVALALASVVAAVGFQVQQQHARPAIAAVAITLQQLPGATGLTNPLGIVSAGDSRLFILEKPGRIRIYDGGTLLATPFLDITAGVGPTANEDGLLGLAFHPNYPATPYFYVHHTNPSGDIVIDRYTVSADPNIADAGSGVVLRTISHPVETNHNGGQLAFGPDGYLYIAIGDGGDGLNNNNAQDINAYLGKLLRLDVNQNVATPPYYGIPPTNPYAGVTPGLDEIWAVGLRNPWRFSFDKLTGDLLIADVGQDAAEEIDLQASGAAGGVNYGWRIMEGSSCYINEGVGCGHPSLTLPIIEYNHDAGDCSVTGGYRYRGAATSFAGTYLYADFCTGRIWGATQSGPSWISTLLLDSPYFISTFGQDTAGELYIADYFGGAILRVVVADTDNDGIPDAVDNCPNNANPGQENSDANFTDQTPPSTQDDRTWPNSDPNGNACDTDDDNDGLLDVNEPAGCNGSGPLSPTNRDTDGDRVLDGAECTLSTNPASAASKPTAAACAAFLGIGASIDTDGDRIFDRAEYCGYNTNRLLLDTDGDQDALPLNANPAVNLIKDGCEAASLNNDRVVNSADQLLLALEIVREVDQTLRLVSMDINKDGGVNSGDQLLVVQFISTAGECP